MAEMPVVLQKITRADQHVEDLNQAAERFFDDTRGKLYRFHGKPETKGRKDLLLFRTELLQPLPLVEWGIRVGDAIHCLRSALDQLAYSLSASPDGLTAFPIFRGEKDWATKSPPMLWGIPDPLIAVIKSHQPYHRGDRAHTHPLALLSALSNADKHRYIPVMSLVPSLMEWGIVGYQGVPDFGDMRIKPGATLETGAVIAEMPFTPAGPPEDAEVQMNAEVRFRIAFGKTGVPSSLAGKPLTPAYNEIAEAVVEVIKEVMEAAHGATPP